MRFSKLFYISIFTILVFTFFAMFAPHISPYDPNEINLKLIFSPPSKFHIFGCDSLGRDILSRVIYGSRISLSIGIVVVLITSVFGIFYGAISGFFGGVIDMILMRIVDILLAFPGILLAIALAGILGPSFLNIIFALSLMGWTGYARIVRAQVLSLKERDFVLSAKLSGSNIFYILIFHIIPNVLPYVLVEASFGVGSVILAESTLSFLGLGPKDFPSWGGMLNEGVENLLFAPHISIFPGIAIMLIVLSFNFLGDELSEILSKKDKY